MPLVHKDDYYEALLLSTRVAVFIYKDATSLNAKQVFRFITHRIFNHKMNGFHYYSVLDN